MQSRYGYFAEGGAEFVITRWDTPRPWVNYLTNGDYCALCSHLGGGFSFFKDHRYNALLRRGRQQQLEDLPARLVYLKDEATGEVWTANVLPFLKSDAFEARQGMGYTTLSNTYGGVRSDLTYFVPPGLDAEMWHVVLTNTGDAPRTLSVYSCAEFQLGNLSLDELEPVFMSLFNDVSVDDATVTIVKKWWHPHHGWSEDNGIWANRVFAATPVPHAALMCNRDAFFGPFRTQANPIALEAETLPEAPTSGKDPVLSYQWRITLQPGETWETYVAIGVQSNDGTPAPAALADIATYRDAWARTRAHWRDLFSTLSVTTPDEDVNIMMNWWNKYQVMANFHFGRGPSYYHKGQYPAMRDSCQDAFGVIPLNPELAKGNIRRIAGFFFADGRACGGCNRIGLPEGPSEKVDLPLWLILTVSDYLRETGDFAFLDEPVPLMDGGTSTIYEKMIAGIERMLTDSGDHGLPLIGKGDWNDAANAIGAGGTGESVWLGQFLYFVIHEMAPLMARRGDARRETYLARAAEIKRVVNEHCWDGEWFVRAFKDDGTPVGVRGQKEGFIWINSQTWAVIADISTPERLNRCMDAVEEHLGTDYGLMNLAPAFTEIDESIGIITRFLAGWKENAAVFSHASAFNVVARAMLGRGRDAVDLFRRIIPMSKDSDRYLVEPYVYSQFCVGPARPDEHGRGAYHWLTGTAAWMLRAMTDYIIGVHPELDGLRIRPAVDPSWTEFSITRSFRGSVYDITFHNPSGVETGLAALTLDGQPVDGDLLPLPTKPRHTVEVTMGKVPAVV
jgi:cellobiose phosphorylase